MRPTADILADLDAPAPVVADLDAWDAFCDRVTPAEQRDALTVRPWLELCDTYRAGAPLTIPAGIERDPRLSSAERFVLAALADVRRDVDTSQSEAFSAVCVRIFGEGHDEHDRACVREAVDRLVSVGILVRTTRGGLHVGRGVA